MAEKEKEEKQEKLFSEFEFWTKKAIQSPEWKHLAIVFEKHKQGCDKQVHIYVRSKEWIEAYGWQMKADQIGFLLKKIDKRIAEVKKEVENG